MDKLFLRALPVLITLLVIAPAVGAQNIVLQADPAKSSTTIYRQVLPDGRVVYSDRPAKGMKVERTIAVAPPIKGNVWSSSSQAGPVSEPLIRTKPMTISQSVDSAHFDVVKAERLLEEAKKNERDGIEPLPGERTATVTGSRLNETYDKRQQSLHQAVLEAEENLNRALKERDALR